MKQLMKYKTLLLGTISLIGGLLWVVWVMITASRPLLPPHGYRDNDDIAMLMGVSMLFMAVGIFGIYVRQKTKKSRMGKTALYTGVIGAILALIGSVLITIYSSNFVLVPIFFGSGGLLLSIGIILTGISIIQTRILPNWSGWLLIGSVLFGLTGDENSSNVLVILTLGIAWIIVGAILAFYPSKFDLQHPAN